jgi:molecular chaperone DnaK
VEESGPDDAEVAALLDKASARLDAAEEEDRHEMIDLMETIRDAHAAGDAATLELARTQLSDLLFYLET